VPDLCPICARSQIRAALAHLSASVAALSETLAGLAERQAACERTVEFLEESRGEVLQCRNQLKNTQKAVDMLKPC
jgi:hypothetical protein